MRILLFGKYPPIQGGTSSQVFNTVRHLARAGHDVDVVTNGRETEATCRAVFTAEDHERLDALNRDCAPGQVRVHYTTPLGPTSYIPWSQPFASKLFGLGIDLAAAQRYDLVVGWYFEPFGLVAAQVAEAVGAPLLIRHAGSDLVRLARHPDLRGAYGWMLAKATYILTGPRSRQALTRLGADPACLRMTGPGQIPDYFADAVSPLDVSEFAEAATKHFESLDLSDSLRDMLTANLLIRPSGPVIGISGKVAPSKGTYDLLAALEELADEGIGFTLVAAVGGQRALLVPFFEALAATSHLRRQAIVLPLLAPWRMPGFFDLCDLVCLLEHDFDVNLHLTRVPLEVLRRGRALVVSKEMSGKVYFRDRLVDRVNYLCVDDPEETGALAALLRQAVGQPDLRARVAAGGASLAGELVDSRTVDGPSAAILDALADLGPDT